MSNKFTHGYALLIGVGESAYNKLSLPVTVKDTQAIYAALIDPELCAYPNDKEHIRVLNNKEATKVAILDSLNWLKDKAKSDPNATIFIYYSGHGWLKEENNRYYLIQHDIDPFDLAGSALSAETFTDVLREIPAERLFVVIDSCHAAGMATSKDGNTAISSNTPAGFVEASPSKGLIEELKKGKGRVVFTSSEGTQSSFYVRDESLSIYTYHFLEALQGAGNQPGDMEVRISNIMNHVGKTVPDSVRSQYKQEQIPQFDMTGGDFAIAQLRGDKGLPNKGWDEVRSDATQKINRIAQNIQQYGRYITNINEVRDVQNFHIGDVINKN
ncbi:caspase family protein [Nostoc sp. CALU 546]|uniref:caspase family protein n=1 Tax=Nostoc sp. CALU 546 TaxID=1867241 RepID=UPI003B675A00